MKAVKMSDGRYYLVRRFQKGTGFKAWWLVKYLSSTSSNRGGITFEKRVGLPKELIGQRVRIIIEPIDEVSNEPQIECEVSDLIKKVEQYKRYKTRYTHLVELLKENEIKLGKSRGGRIEQQQTNRQNGSKDEQDEQPRVRRI